ncbi:MAG: ion channel [Bryobacteraceae bacterium]
MATPFPTSDARSRGAGLEADRDLGLGGQLAERSGRRLMNADGSVNVRRTGARWRDFFHPYHLLLTVSWSAFFGLVLAAYLALNLAFAGAYLACGPGALSGADSAGIQGRFADAFFFSVQTIATIGYGKMTPQGVAANLLVAIEALTGLLGFAFATGVMFARFSRPSARLAFSGQAVVAPYRGGRAVMFRAANARQNELTDVRATVSMARLETIGGRRIRKFHALPLERSSVTFLSTQWVVVHPIDERSPFWGVNEEEFRASDPEVLVLIAAMDETFSQTVQVRRSYQGAEEFAWGVKFRDIYEREDDGAMRIDVRRLGEVDEAELPPIGSAPGPV